MLGDKYYKVMPDWYLPRMYMVKVWRWYWPFWTEAVGLLPSKEKAHEWIAMDSVYYDGAE